jgi:hypothetical protein
MRNDHRAAIDKIVLKWMRLQAIYFEAVHRLSDHYRRYGDQVPDVEISLLAVKTPYVVMEHWEHTIRKAIVRPSPDLLKSDSSFDAETAMSLIRDLGRNGDAPGDGKLASMLRIWGCSLFAGSIHCDAALTSLMKHGGAINSIFGSTACLCVEV